MLSRLTNTSYRPSAAAASLMPAEASSNATCSRWCSVPSWKKAQAWLSVPPASTPTVLSDSAYCNAPTMEKETTTANPSPARAARSPRVKVRP